MSNGFVAPGSISRSFPASFRSTTSSKVARFSKATGANVPAWLAARFEGLEEDAHTRSHVAAAVCAEQVLDLQQRGLSEFHFYTMNRADLVYSICHILGLRGVSGECQGGSFAGIGRRLSGLLPPIETKNGRGIFPAAVSRF